MTFQRLLLDCLPDCAKPEAPAMAVPANPIAADTLASVSSGENIADTPIMQPKQGKRRQNLILAL